MNPQDAARQVDVGRTDHAILFFDGVCGLCNRVVDWIIPRDRRHRIRFAPLQGGTAASVVPPELRENLSTLVFHVAGRNHLRSAAVCRILMTIGGVWWFAGAVLWLVPWPVRDLGYRIVARVRYRLFGRHDSCRLPTAADRALFLD